MEKEVTWRFGHHSIFMNGREFSPTEAVILIILMYGIDPIDLEIELRKARAKLIDRLLNERDGDNHNRKP